MKILPVLALLLISLAGCGQHPSAAGSESHVFRYAMAKDPPTLDPALSQELYSGEVLSQVFEGLVRSGENNRYEPLLASSWEIKDGGKTYIFHLKKGVKFSNGRPLAAQDFKWTIERNCNPKLNTILARNYLGDIDGAIDKIEGRAMEVKGVEATDPETLCIRLVGPRPYFLGKLTFLVASVICPQADPTGAEIDSPMQAVGTGPFILTRFGPAQAATFSPNPFYHDGRPPLDKLEILIIKDSSTRLNKYRAGELDILTLGPQDVEGARTDPVLSKQMKSYERAALVYLGLDRHAYPPFRDRRVRRAFAMAIDRRQIVDQVLEGAETLADGILPAAMPGHRPNAAVLPYDPAAARGLLSEAGFADGSKLPPLLLFTTDQSPERRVVAEAVVTQLRKNLGVDVKVQFFDMGAFLQRTTNHQASIYLGSWYADYLDPENFLSVTLAAYGQNRVDYDNPLFTQLCRKADSMPDGPERMAVYGEAEDLALQDAAWIPMYFSRDSILVNPKVKGLRANVFGFLPHATVQIP